MALNDIFILASNLAFQGRVQAALVAGCVAVANEGLSVNNHVPRLQLVHQILASPTNLQNYVTLFSNTVATDSTVIADATQANTVPLTAGNVPAQQALVTDAHINAALSSSVNALAQGIVA